MGLSRIGMALSILFLTVPFLTACGSAEWVHPNQPKDQFAQENNRCENQSLQDPRLQGGAKLMLQQAIENCLAKNGWVLRETRQ